MVVDGQPLHWVGLVGIMIGTGFLAVCIVEFARSGRGTLSPADPPRTLVVRGPYRYVRNPMYLSVTVIVLGEVGLTASRGLFSYWVIWFAAVNLFVMGYEEPTLRHQFGATYERYAAGVGRWLPRLRPWRGESPVIFEALVCGDSFRSSCTPSRSSPAASLSWPCASWSGRLIAGAGSSGLVGAARIFVGLWLVIAGINMWIGVSQAGYSVADEAPIFLVVFGVPAGVAGLLMWWLSQGRRLGMRVRAADETEVDKLAKVWYEGGRTPTPRSCRRADPDRTLEGFRERLHAALPRTGSWVRRCAPGVLHAER